MTHLEWYRHLRSGLDPQPARFAWTQALLYDGKTPDEVNAKAQGNMVRSLDALVIANYASSRWNMLMNRKPFWKLFTQRR